MNLLENEKGITLIEVLVAVGVLTIILLSVYGTFFSVNSAVTSSDREMLRFREIREFFDMAKREIESCFLNPSDSNTFFTIKDRDVYGLQASELFFTAFVPYGNGLHYIEYTLDKEAKVLYKKVAGLWNEKTGEKSKILEEVDEFKVEANNTKRWIGTFDTELSNSLPTAVRITLKFRVEGEEMVLQKTIETKLGG